jgi:hypothetical protein
VAGEVVENVSKQGGGEVLLIVLAAIAVAFGYPALNARSLAIWRRIGITVTVIVLSIFVISNWSDFNSIRSQFDSSTGLASVNAGSGLYLYTVAVIAIWISAVRIWLAKIDHSARVPSQVAFNSGPGATTQGWVAAPTQGPPATAPLNPPPNQPASGWYPDPQRVARLRYWDGGAWTEQTQA